MSTGKHPQLAKKLTRLYTSCINPSVNTNAALAKHLGISRQAISKWIHGSDTSIGDCIPHSQIHEVAELFGMEPFWFSLELSDFNERLESVLEPDRHTTPLEKISISSLPISSLELFGRTDEIAALDRAWDNRETNCMEIIAFGGVGKSSLVTSWLSHFDKLDYAGAKRVYCWSFYWQGAGTQSTSSGDLFIEQALEWFGDAEPEKGTPWSKANRLASLVRESRTLLVLDGLEPLQYPPGPKQGEIETPALSMFLKELAANNNGLCIITSRIPIAELASFNDGRIESVHLNRLSTDDGIRMLSSMGISGENKDMQSAVEAYSGHPLCLSLLAGYLSVVHDGEVAGYRALDSLAGIENFDSHAGTIVRAYLQWFDSSCESALLNLLGLFDRCIPIDDVRELVETQPVAELTEELSRLTDADWKYAIKKLEDANLLFRYKRDEQTMIDCHPLVRDFLNERLKNENVKAWRKGNESIFNFLQAEAVIDPTSMLEMEPLFRAVIHGTRAGLFEASFQLYFERIKQRQFSLFTEGSHHADQSCIRAFFENPWTEPVNILSESARFYLLACAAANLAYLGQIDEAIEPSIKSIKWFQRHEQWVESAVTSGPLISMLIAAGRLDEARKEWDGVQESVRNADNEVLSAVSNSIGAYLSFLEGDVLGAGKLFQDSESILNRPEVDCEIVCPTISAYYCTYLLGTGNTELALARALKSLQWRESSSWQLSVDTTSLYASDLIVLGLIYLSLEDLENAAFYLNKQVELLKSANEWLYLPSGLIARARMHVVNAAFTQARRDLEEALIIAKSTGAKYSEGEAQIALSELALKQGDVEAGKVHYENAATLTAMKSFAQLNANLTSLESQLYTVTD